MKHRGILFAILASFFLMGLPSVVLAGEIECPQWVAKLVSVEGRVESLLSHETEWQPAKQEDTYCPEDRVRTLAKSRAAILLQNETILRLNQKTTVKFTAFKDGKPTLLDFLKGSGFYMSRFPRTLTIETPFVNASSEGTEFLIEVDEANQTATITVLEGRMTVANQAGSVSIGSGQAAVTKAGERPVVRIVVRPRDAVQWALYYPPVLSLKELRLGDTRGLPETVWRVRVTRSIESYQAGDVAQAFSALEGAPEAIDDPRFYNYRASLLLAVGQIDEARSDIDKSLGLAPRNGHALALQSIIAVVQNEKEKALGLALGAVEAERNSVTAKIALSYAHQANFELPEALAAVREAVELDPENPLSRARLAELWMAQGDLDQALEAAKEATALNPREARAQTVLGFAYLVQIKISESKEAFEKAITLAQADPLPRLGLGLAKIREGDLEGGRKEIEIAASLDPNNALIRSYLGKAYYEEKRDKLAEVQFELAKELDPKDPTAFFYDAIRKQTINRPVEALHDLQKSIELNDNRAVYRSRLLLDNDLAARSVSLGRIYDDLGFQQLALVEGWKSVNMDPANYSAHRFLSDSYAALPRSEIARLSELLQSQLLQPINNNPVQPRLGESAPAILAGSGPVDASFNEFSQLFIRDGLHFLGSGVWGEDSTLGEEVIQTGLYKRYSYSLGQFHTETDGFRANADITQNIYDVFTQVSLTPKASIQGEYRYNETKNGDIDLRFDPANFSPTFQRKQETDTYRLGFHYALTPRSDLITSFLYQTFEHDFNDSSIVLFPPTALHTLNLNSDAYTGEAQYLFRTERLNLILGGGYFDAKINRDDFFDLGLPSPPFPPPTLTITEDHSQHTNIYFYSLMNFPFNATLTAGGSGDFFKGQPRDQNQFNPKIGLTWNPTPATTLRIAAFRSFRRSTISNQTIESTQVAGFQQFFDDPPATDMRRYGAGVDQKFPSGLFGGLEVSKRDVEVPVGAAEVDVDERQGRAYLYWTPLTWAAASAEYQYERSDSDDNTAPFAPKITTQRVPLGLNFYHPCGFFAKLKATYIDQTGTFLNVSSGSFESGGDQFWLADASIGYRLPKRWGIFTIEAKNLFDESFQFQDTVLSNPTIQPGRLIFTKLTLSF